MDELKEYQPPAEIIDAPEPKKAVNPYMVIAIIIAVVAMMIVVLALLYNKVQNEKKELEAALAETEKQLEVKNDAFSALEAQQKGQQTVIQGLQDQVDSLLNAEEAAPVITSVQVKEQLTSVKELVTKKYIYTNASRREANKSWLWGWDMPFSSTSLLVTYDGTIRAGIDLSKVNISINEDDRTIEITVPAGEILSHELPQESITVLDVKNNLFNEITFDDYNEFIANEKPVMEQKVIDRGLLIDARDEAKAIIRDAMNLLPGSETYQISVN